MYYLILKDNLDFIIVEAGDFKDTTELRDKYPGRLVCYSSSIERLAEEVSYMITRQEKFNMILPFIPDLK